MGSPASFAVMDWWAWDRASCVKVIKPRLTSSTAMVVFLCLSGYGSIRGFELRRSCFALNPATTTSGNRELSPGPISRGLSLILFTPEQTSKHSGTSKNPFAHEYSTVVLVLCASGSFGIVRFENKQTAQGGRPGANPDVESGFKELIKCWPEVYHMRSANLSPALWLSQFVDRAPRGIWQFRFVTTWGSIVGFERSNLTRPF
jgi:hypothetical protein